MRFPIWSGQLLRTECQVLIDGKVVATCRQGEIATVELTSPTEIQVKAKGAFGAPRIHAEPGDRFSVGYRGFGKLYISKVDMFSGGENRD